MQSVAADGKVRYITRNGQPFQVHCSQPFSRFVTSVSLFPEMQHDTAPSLLVRVMSLSCWLVATVPQASRILYTADFKPMQVFPKQHHDHKCKVCEEGITDVNSQLSLMKEYKHFPLAVTDFLKPAFHHLSEFLHHFCVLQRWIQLHCKQGLCTVMQLSIRHTCKGAWGPDRAEL